MMNNSLSALSGSATQMKCAIYTRYASVLQVPAPTDIQEEDCRAAAAQLGWTVLDRFVQTDRGVYGMTLAGRTGLSSLIEHANNFPGTFGRVLVADASRLSRKPGDLVRVVETFAQHGISLYFLRESLDSRGAIVPAIRRMAKKGLVEVESTEGGERLVTAR